MKYPRSIDDALEEAMRICDLWPKKPEVDIVNWIMQFDVEDNDLAIRIVRHLNVIGYDDLVNALSVAYSKLARKAKEKGTSIQPRNTLFAGIGGSGKSGSMIEYHLRMVNDKISEENYLSDESMPLIKKGLVENIVLVDDILMSGNQSAKEIKKITEQLTPLGVKNIFLLTALGMRQGLAKVYNETKAHTFSAFEYDSEDTAVCLDSRFYDGVPFEQRSSMRSRLEQYGRSCAPKTPLGYSGLGTLIAFYYNTPNSTLPVVWSDSNSWMPLFKRVKRINGIAAYFSQFDAALKAKEQAEPPKHARAKQENMPDRITIFVEGKEDEWFFDQLMLRFDLAKMIGVKRVWIASLGGLSEMVNLAEPMLLTGEKFVFVVDNDREAENKAKAMPKGAPVVILMQSVLEFIDVEAAVRDGRLDSLVTESDMPTLRSNPNAARGLIVALKTSIARRRIVGNLVEDYSKLEAVQRFAERVAKAAGLMKHG